MLVLQAVLALATVILPPEDPTIVVEHRDGSLERRPVPLPGAEPADWFGAQGDVVRLRVSGVALVVPRDGSERGAEVRLASGDALSGKVTGGAGETLHLSLLGTTQVELGIESLRSIVFPDRFTEIGRDPVHEGDGAPAEGDRLHWRKGESLDTLDGAVAEFQAEGVLFESVLGLKTFPWDEVAALFIETFDDGDRARPDGRPVAIDLFDGSRLRGALDGLDASGLGLRWGGDVHVRIPLGAVAEVVLDDGTVEYLGALPPSAADLGSPFDDDLGMVWPHRVDRSVTGGPLVAGGRRHMRGVGVHAPSRVEWELGGRWSSLRGHAALDDEVLRLPARGSVRFRVVVDGEVRWESPVMRGGDPPLPFGPLELAGAQHLALEVDMADDLHLGDRADWLGLLLVR